MEEVSRVSRHSGSSREVIGTLVDQQTERRVHGNEATFRIDVRLENGQWVSARITSRTPARLGLRVTLDELTLWGGVKRYRFKYLHPESDKPSQSRQ